MNEYQKRYARTISFNGRTILQYPRRITRDIGKKIAIPRELLITDGEAPTDAEWRLIYGAWDAARSPFGYALIQDIIYLTGLPRDRVHRIVVYAVKQCQARLSSDRWGRAINIKIIVGGKKWT